MQRAIVDQYISKHGVKINDYQFENEFLDWLPGLEKYITGYNIDAIAMCSIFNLPDDADRRYELLKLAVDSGVELHFANEVCSVRDYADIEHIKHIFEFVNENPDPNLFLGFTGAKETGWAV
jgi:sporadic carbohydrate cluster protein (TIGR04323 family)